MRSTEQLVEYLLNRINYISRGVSLRDLFEDEWFEQIEGQARASLDASVAGVPLSPPDLCSYLYLTEHHRRFTVPSLELFRQHADVRLPFLDEDFLRVLFSGRPEWRDGTDIHKAIIAANCPAMLKVRNSNTGAPADASPRAEKIFDKINSLFKRLNVYGYRHYHSFHRWMRELLLDAVERVLLSPEAMSRRIYRESALRRLVEETRRGTADHAYLLQILLIVEIWQRQSNL